MSTDWIKRRQTELLAQATEFSSTLSAAPVAYAMTAGDATALETDVADLQAALAAALNPATRTPVTISEKDLAINKVVARLRNYGQRIQAAPTVTPVAKIAIGLRPHDVQPTPVPAPAQAPLIALVSVTGRAVRIRLRDAANPTRRGRPDFVAGATILSHVGDAPPENLSGFKWEGNISKTSFDVLFPSTVPAGSTVWITAQWYNAKSQPGPAANPLSVSIAGSATQQAA